MKKIGVWLLFQLITINWGIAQNNPDATDCTATLENGLLTLGNSRITRTYMWNNGNLITRSLTDNISGTVWQMNSNKPDMMFPGQTVLATQAVFNARIVPETAIAPKHTEAEVTYMLDKLEVKRVFRIYPDCPAIACDLYLRGETKSEWLQPGINLADMVNLEKLSAANTGNNAPVIEKLELSGQHWRLHAVEFYDITDRYNTLVFEVKAMSYRTNFYRGNILFAHNNLSGNGIFILKESPTSNVQLAYPGSDFITEFGNIRLVGAGLSPGDLNPTEWRRAYGFVTGVYAGDEKNSVVALREYQKRVRIHQRGRDEMVMMNTWGDRGQDSRIGEKFALAELNRGARLGITHFQLDDGWQTGRSSNSALKGGSLNNIWDNKNYWEPDTTKFPNGLEPIVSKGKELGIEICLWFNPSRDNSNAAWEKDANALIGLNRKYGIRTFKIDGVNLPDKLAEVNFRKFLDRVNQETNNGVVFNLDVTAGRRGGYHYLNEYGNIFLENRYTDWQNYYPYATLRNLWMLSRYLPAQNLQIEFLNKWRNTEKYKDDPFAPSNYTFDYLFAITMPSQPLAWLEATGLPEEAISVAGPVIRKYRELQFDFHSGNILPLGDEPSGRSWTGFQSVQQSKGYFLLFREQNPLTKTEMETWLAEGTTVQCTPVLGKGKEFSAKVGRRGTISFELPEINSYALYRYSIK